MNWIFFALLAPVVYSVVTFVDKYLLEAEVKDYNAMPVYMGIVAAIAGIIIFLATGMPVLPLTDMVIVLATGVFSAYSLALYFTAMSMEDASHINILFMTFPIMTLVLSYIVLGERISPQQFLGFTMILTATIGVSIQKGDRFFSVSPAFFLILLHNFLWAMSGVFMKFALNVTEFSHVLSYESFGIALGAFFLYIGTPAIRKAFVTTNTHISNRARVIIGINEFFTILAKAITFFAFSLGPVTLVSVLEGMQAFFAIGIGWTLTIAFPHIFDEDISRTGIIKKLLCAALAICGIYLLS